MRGSIPARAARLAAAVLAASALSAMAAGAADAEVVYSNIPSPFPGNFASFGNEAYSNSEFGGMVEVGGTAHKRQQVTVAMSSWACQFGSVYPDTCETPKPNKKFKWPITLKIYEVGPGGSVGAKIAETTKTFAMPYRPTRTPAQCEALGAEPGEWYDSTTKKCSHGLAFTITFKALQVEVRKQEIITVSYNTSTHGPAPIGHATACYSTVAGCYYDSLNVAIIEPAEGAPSKGHNPTKDLYLNSEYGAMYCGSSTPVGTFGPTAPIEGTCASNNPYETEENIQPAFSVDAH
jgi:hypothetical protein